MDSYENGLHSEVFNIDDADLLCNELEYSPPAVEGAAGALVSGKPMICGGFFESPLGGGSDKCFIVGENQPITMEHERTYPASIPISRDKVSHFTFYDKYLRFENYIFP